MPALRRLLVALRHVVAPRRRAPEAVVDGRPEVVDLLRPRQLLRALDCFQPDAAHLRLDLAAAVRPDTAARAVPQRLGAVHRARQPGRVEDALAAHLAAEDRPLDSFLDQSQDAHHATAAASRARAIRSLASRTAVEASAA